MDVGIINTEIRDFVNNSVIKKTYIFSNKQNGFWGQFCSALDTIGDTVEAVEAFLKIDGELFKSNPYIFTCGLLQALYIQQDAVSHLKISLLGESQKINWVKEYPKIYQIRSVRNETIGHPTKTKKNGRDSKYNKGEVTTCTIDRSSLSIRGFGYMLYMNSKTEHKHINFEEIIAVQDKNLMLELSKILGELKKEERQHKLKFKNDKLAGLLSNKSLYQVNLIYGVHWQDHLAWPSFDHYHKQYKKVRDGLEIRYGKFGSILRIPGTEMVVIKLDYIFSKIEMFKNTRQFNEHEFEIYVDALDASLKELETHLIAIDEEFKL